MAEETNELTEQEAMDFRADMVKEYWGEDADSSMPPVDEPGVQDDPPPNDPPANDDPWAEVPPALRQQFEDLKAKAERLDTIEGRLQQAERRIGAVTNELHNKGKEAAKETDDAPTQEQIDAAAKSAEEWKELEEEFPEWTKAMNARLQAEKAESNKTIKALQAEIDTLKESGGNQQAISTLRDEITREVNKDLLMSRYPDYEQIAKSPDFVEFVKARPDLQTKCQSWKAADAIYVLDQFKGSKNARKSPDQIKKERQQRLSQSHRPSSGRPRQTAKSEDDMTDEEYRAKVAREMWGT